MTAPPSTAIAGAGAPVEATRARLGAQPRVTAGLAEFIAGARWSDLPQHVRHEATRSLVNYFAVALGGCRDQVVDRVSSALDVPSGMQATVIGRGERRGAYDAAFLNAISANVFDFDDTHAPTIIHPTAPVAAPLFAYAEGARLSGRDLLLAFALGVEVECRLGVARLPWPLSAWLAHHFHVRRFRRGSRDGQGARARCATHGMGAGQCIGKLLRLDRDARQHGQEPWGRWLRAQRLACRGLRTQWRLRSRASARRDAWLPARHGR